jgi:hypothetical protein
LAKTLSSEEEDAVKQLEQKLTGNLKIVHSSLTLIRNTKGTHGKE